MYPFRNVLGVALVALSLDYLPSQESVAQQRKLSQNVVQFSEVPQISGGGEMNMLRNRGMQATPKKFSPSALTPPARVAAGPALSGSFDAVDFDADGTYSGYYHIPPDPIGAAGASHLVCVVNTSIQWYTKAGVLVGGKRLGKNATTVVGSFFESLSPLTGSFDPKVIYDQYAGRFVVVALEQTDVSTGGSANTSRIFVAVSATSDPGGTWYFVAINSMLNISGADRWADYPGLAVDDKAVYVTANMFGFGASGTYGGARLWIVDKGLAGGFYGGGTALVNLYDPPGASGATATTMQPTHMFGTVPTGMGTFLARYSGFSDGTDEYLSIIRVDNPLTTPTFTHAYVSCGDIDNTAAAMPNAPQLGTATLINTNDRRSLNAVWSSNRLYVATTLVPPSGTDAGQATAHWFNVNTTTLSSLTLADQGNIGGEDIATGTHTFYPSIAVDPSGNLGMGFAASASTIYPGAYFTGRFSSDPAGTNRGSGVLRAGLDYYVRTFGSGRNRWGDYSGASIDPSDGSFWFFNQYAMARGTPISSEDGRWKTAFGNLPPTALPVQIASFVGTVDGDHSALLRWETISEINNLGFEIQKSTDPFVGYLTIPNSFVPGHGTTNVPQQYSYRDATATNGVWYYMLKQIDLDGTLHYTQGVQIEILPGLKGLEIPAVASLDQNFPNPFNPTTVIRYGLPRDLQVDLTVSDALGRTVADLVHGRQEAGNHEVTFGSPGLPSGVYFYRLQAGDFVQTRKLLLLK